MSGFQRIAIVGIAAALLAISAGWLTAHSLANMKTPAGPYTDIRQLEKRISRLETSQQQATNIQNHLLALLEDIYKQGPKTADTTADSASTPPVLADRLPGEMPQPEIDAIRTWYARYHTSGIHHLVDAGLSQFRAAEIIAMEQQFLRQRLETAYLQGGNSLPNDRLMALDRTIDYNMYQFLQEKLTPSELKQYVEASGRNIEITVTNVSSNGAATNSGLKPGDRIVTYNDAPIFNPENLTARIRRLSPGEVVKLEIVRTNGNRRETIYVPSGSLGIQGTPER